MIRPHFPSRFPVEQVLFLPTSTIPLPLMTHSDCHWGNSPQSMLHLFWKRQARCGGLLWKRRQAEIQNWPLETLISLDAERDWSKDKTIRGKVRERSSCSISTASHNWPMNARDLYKENTHTERKPAPGEAHGQVETQNQDQTFQRL